MAVTADISPTISTQPNVRPLPNAFAENKRIIAKENTI
ncbi:hypothetical protein [Xanthomonas phage XAJ2]|uniref:Uncharacterized protein n=1 Tax=Xanthomonas phage XAJ2 TaxID=1775249 RepID=A0A1I9L2G1_9CAUD|nr:hypothetical protein [Xanthomonas phage XAJ2]